MSSILIHSSDDYYVSLNSNSHHCHQKQHHYLENSFTHDKEKNLLENWNNINKDGNDVYEIIFTLCYEQTN